MSITDIYGLQQLITEEPTRITPTSATLIDVIYTNCPDKVVCSGVRHISISDHSIVFAYRKLSVNGMSGGHNAITYRNFRKFNRINFRNDIASHCWDHIYNSTQGAGVVAVSNFTVVIEKKAAISIRNGVLGKLNKVYLIQLSRWRGGEGFNTA